MDTFNIFIGKTSPSRIITANGHNYSWKAGESHVEIRALDSDFRLVVKRPVEQRWAILQIGYDNTGIVKVFSTEKECRDAFEKYNSNSAEIVQLPDRAKPIMPSYIKGLLDGSQKPSN